MILFSARVGSAVELSVVQGLDALANGVQVERNAPVCLCDTCVSLCVLPQARYLLAKLNPSATYNTAQNAVSSSEVIMTDDVSLQVFTEHLKRLAVQS